MEFIDIIQIILTAIFSGSFVSLFNIKQFRKQEKLKTKKIEQELAKQFIDDYNQTIIVPLKDDVKRLSKEVSILKDAINMQRYCKYEGPCIIIKQMDESKSENIN